MKEIVESEVTWGDKGGRMVKNSDFGVTSFMDGS